MPKKKFKKSEQFGFQMNPDMKAATYMAGKQAFALKPIPAGDKGKGLRKMASSEKGSEQVKDFGYDPATAMKPASYMANLDNARNEKGVITPSAMKMIGGSLLSKSLAGVREGVNKLGQSRYVNLSSKYTKPSVNSEGVRYAGTGVTGEGNIVSKTGEVFDKKLGRNLNTYTNFDTKSGEVSGILNRTGGASVTKPSSRELTKFRTGERYVQNREAQYYLNFDPKEGYGSKATFGIEYSKDARGNATSARVTNEYAPQYGKVYNLRDSNEASALKNTEMYLSRQRDNMLSRFQGNFKLYDNMMSGNYKGHLNNPQDNYSGMYGEKRRAQHKKEDERDAKMYGAPGSDKFNQRIASGNKLNMPNLFETGLIPKFKKPKKN